MSEKFERILQEIMALSLDEQRQLAAILEHARVPASEGSAERQFEAKLEIEGWLSLPATPIGNPLDQAEFPLHVRGQPCSEMLIMERR